MYFVFWCGPGGQWNLNGSIKMDELEKLLEPIDRQLINMDAWNLDGSISVEELQWLLEPIDRKLSNIDATKRSMEPIERQHSTCDGNSQI